MYVWVYILRRNVEILKNVIRDTLTIKVVFTEALYHPFGKNFTV